MERGGGGVAGTGIADTGEAALATVAGAVFSWAAGGAGGGPG